MNGNTTLRTVAAIVVVALVATSTVGVSAVAATDDPPPLPHSFHGSVYVDGDPAPTGTEVVAVVDGEERGSAVVDENGTYGGPTIGDEKLVVTGDSDDEGATIIFFVEGVEVNQTIAWTSGGNDELDLTVEALPENSTGGGLPVPPPADDEDEKGNETGGGADGSGDDTGSDDGESTGTDGDDGTRTDVGTDTDGESGMPGFGAPAALIAVLVGAVALRR